MNWISVKDELPDKDEVVLVWNVFDGVALGYRCNPASWHVRPRFGAWYNTGLGVTHWMPLPEKPERNDEP
jgi:hypothetical protein